MRILICTALLSTAQAHFLNKIKPTDSLTEGVYLYSFDKTAAVGIKDGLLQFETMGQAAVSNFRIFNQNSRVIRASVSDDGRLKVLHQNGISLLPNQPTRLTDCPAANWTLRLSPAPGPLFTYNTICHKRGLTILPFDSSALNDQREQGRGLLGSEAKFMVSNPGILNPSGGTSNSGPISGPYLSCTQGMFCR